MFKSNYIENVNFGNMALKEGYKLNSIRALLDELDGFDFKVIYDGSTIKGLYDMQLNEVHQDELYSIEDIFNHMEGYFENWIIECSNEEEYKECIDNLNSIRNRK